MKSVLKTLATTALVAFTAVVFTACNDNRDCAYNEAGHTLACPEKTYKTVALGGKTWMAENLDMFTPDSSVCYANNHDNCNTDGRLYTFVSATGNVCPTGWALPTVEDFKAAFGASEPAALKNANGFNALLAGFKYYDGNFADKGVSASFWTSDSYDDSRAYLVRITDSGIAYEHFNKNIFASVRCIKK